MLLLLLVLGTVGLLHSNLLLLLHHASWYMAAIRLRHHVLVKVVDGVRSVGCRLVVLDLHLVQVLVDLRLERLLDHLLAFGRGQFVRQPQQELVLFTLRFLTQFPQRILQIV